MELEITEALKPFICHGIIFRYESGGQCVADCPFCLKDGHFYVNKNTGQWDCKVCGEKGNAFTFLGKWAQQIHEETDNSSFEQLSKERGIPIVALRAWRLGWDGTHWLLPVVSGKKTTRDIRRYDPKTGTVKSTSGCHNQLYGEYKARQVPVGGTLWICEGEWDTIAWSYVLGQCGYEDQRAVGVPGANVFKPEWVEIFKDREVILCYDHDEAGQNGMKKAYELLKDVATSIKILQWPKDRPQGYDVRDFYRHYHTLSKKARTIYSKMAEMLVSPADVADLQTIVREGLKVIGEFRTLQNPPSFQSVLGIFKKWLVMDEEMVNALRLSFAVVYSEKLEGDPLWVHLVGPPGAGKTLLLTSLAGSDRCKFFSSISPHALISGYNRQPDPSLLPRFNGFCIVWKDFTELLWIPAQLKLEVYSILRGAYDGQVSKAFGNEVGSREYNNLHFTILAGVTPAIHGDNQALLGERFLKFEMKKGVGWRVDAEIEKVLSNKHRKAEIAKDLQKAAGDFLALDIKRFGLAEVPEWASRRIIALSQVVARMRGHIDREQYGEREMRYGASHEAGTRIAAQAFKLIESLCLVDRTKRVTYEQYSLMERVLLDSMNQTFTDILVFLLGEKNQEATLAEMTPLFQKMSRVTIQRRLDDMRYLGILKAEKRGTGVAGPAPFTWCFDPGFKRLWEESKIGRKLVVIKGLKLAVRRVIVKTRKIVK